MTETNGFLDLPARTAKPREIGLTHVMDKGLTIGEIQGLFETAGDYIDIVKLGWGTSYVTGNLRQKLDLYRSLGIPVVCGGTLLEVAEKRGRFDAYRSWLVEHGFACVEVSDGTIEMPRERKAEIISLLAQDFRVLSEVGSKDAGRSSPPTSGSSGSRRSSPRGPGRSSRRRASRARPASSAARARCARA